MKHRERRARSRTESTRPAAPARLRPKPKSPAAISPLAMRRPAIQAKLEVNEPGDEFEQQAEAVADRVMRAPLPAPAPALPPAPNGSPPDIRRKAQEEEEPCLECDQNPRRIQRQTVPDEETVQRQAMPDEETVQRQETAGEDDTLQRQEMPPEETVQRAGDGPGKPGVSAKTGATIRSPGPGNPLALGVRQRIEPHVGFTLSQVRVHDDNRAARAAGSLRARAFTYGPHIFLNRTESPGDLRLMAHEATHVGQQQGAVRRQPQAEEPDRSVQESDTAPTAAADSAAARSTSAPATVTPGANGAGAAAAPAEVTPAETEGTVEAPEDAAAVESAPAGEAGGAETAAGGGEAAPPAAAGEAGAEVELLMPEPPDSLSPAAEQRLAGVQQRAGATARAEGAMPAAESSVAGARSAVAEPETETQARAEESLVTALGERPEPSAEIEELCARIRQVIKDKRPPDEEALVEAEPEEMAQEAGGQLNENVEGDTQRVQGEYDQMQEQPEGAPASEPAPLEGTPPAGESPNVNATAAAPDAVPAESVSLEGDVEANRQRMEEAGLNSETAQAVQDGPIAEARQAQGELEETAERDPQQVLAEQEAAIASAQADMADLQTRALEALHEARASTTSDREGQQVEMVGSEEEMRAQVGRRANEIFSTAQTQVENSLRDLPRTAMERWETGIERHSETFKQSLRRVERWIEERHESTALAVWDYVAGLPDWVTEEYDRAEQEFGDNVCDLMRDISREVNGVVATCQAIIEQARQDIADLYDSLPEEMQAWAQQEQARFAEQLDGLSNRVNETRDNFNRDLRRRASQAVDEVRQQIHQLRQAARGLVGRVVDAVNEFLEDPVRAIINGLLSLVGIEPAAFWALVARIQQVISDIADDPLNFANNLMEALKQGFQRFFDNIGTHLLNGLLNWLFSAMGNVGVTIPTDFSLKSIITFFLQLMGLSWARIRRLLAKHLGEQNVALIEQAWEIVSTLIEQGPAGIFEMIKDQLNPQAILDMILQTAIDFVVETLIQQVALRIIGMLNPAGAIAQAIELIYKLLKWLFENAARIFTLIETIVNGAADLIAGNIGGMATAVENALARILPIVIDFLAGLLGLGDLPDKIADAVKRLQDWVERILDRVIGFLADRARALLRRLGIGRDDDQQAAGGVKEQARAAIVQQVGNGKSKQEIESIVATVYRQLQPQGLRSLTLRRQDEEGYAIYAAASEEEDIVKIIKPSAEKDYVAHLSARITIERPEEGLGISEWEPVERRPATTATVEEFLEAQRAIRALPPEERIAGEAYREYRERRGVTSRVTSLAVIRPPAGASEIELHTFSGGGRIRGRTTDNSAHAEVRLKEFLAGRGEWTQRISRIQIHIDLSPCRLCSKGLKTLKEIRDMLTGIADKRNAILSWTTFYDDKHIGTRPEDIDHLSQDWTISGPGPSGEDVATEEFVAERSNE